MPALQIVPDSFFPLFRAVRRAGGRALAVGGCVRDALLGISNKDVDIEVHALPLESLLTTLQGFGKVDEVGKSFGVLKLRWHNQEIDVSIPRQDRQTGSKHTDIQATANPFLGTTEAARRRDLTINAIAYDPLQDEFIDPYNGRGDLSARTLRAVDPTTFIEDPLRALRVVQFAARFGFTPDDALTRICAAMDIRHLPSERVRGELEKYLLKGRAEDLAPAWGFAARVGLWAQVTPEWSAYPPALTQAAQQPLTGPARLALLYAAACSGGSVEDAAALLERLRVIRVEGYRVRDHALFALRYLAEARQPMTDARCRTLAEDGPLPLLAALAGTPALLAQARALGVADGPLPPLVMGKDLLALGFPPGDEIGVWLRRVRLLQLAGDLTRPEDALSWIITQKAAEPTP